MEGDHEAAQEPWNAAARRLAHPVRRANRAVPRDHLRSQYQPASCARHRGRRAAVAAEIAEEVADGPGRADRRPTEWCVGSRGPATKGAADSSDPRGPLG